MPVPFDRRIARAGRPPAPATPLLLALCALLAALTAACSDGADPAPGATTGPTYHKDVAPILERSCQVCHQPGDIAPFTLMSYADAKAVAGLMATTTRDRAMPPWGAFETDECAPVHGYRDDLRLSEEEIRIFEDWSAAGAPEGDPADGHEPTTPPSHELSRVDLELAPKEPFVASGDKDQFRCFVIDPQITETKYINGTYFVPENRKVVHHILLFADPTGESAQKADASGGYDCFGGAGIGGGLIAAWAPGGVPTELEPGIGRPIKPGTLLVMQIHYHPAGATADPDSTRVQLRFADTPPEYYLGTSLVGNFGQQSPSGDGLQPGPDDPAGGPAFWIPADAAAHTELMIGTYHEGSVKPIYIYGVGAHMHLVGVDEKVTIEKADGSGELCLLQEPRWNFSWQRSYAFDADVPALPVFQEGDRLKIRCTYDNTMDNDLLARALTDQGMTAPVDVTLGESTLDEMCLAALQVVTPAP